GQAGASTGGLGRSTRLHDGLHFVLSVLTMPSRDAQAVTGRQREISWATHRDRLGSPARGCGSRDRWQGPTEGGMATRRGNRVAGSAIPVAGLTRRSCAVGVAMGARWPASTADIASPAQGPDHGVTDYDSRSVLR